MTEVANKSTQDDIEKPKKTAAKKIFETASDLFYRRGVRAVGVDEIVQEAGVTKPSLYRSYKSKDDLVAACVLEKGNAALSAAYAAMDAVGTDPRKRLDAFLQHQAHKIEQPDFRGCMLSNVAIELPEEGHPSHAVVEDCKKATHALLIDLARDLQAKDPEGLAYGLVLVIEGALASYHVFGSQGPTHAMLATCEALINAHLQS